MKGTDVMSENNNNNNCAFTEERDSQLWATARKSARLANTYGLKTTTVLARLAASRVLGGDDVSALATMVADDSDMQAVGVKASSIRAYGAPLKRLANVLPVSVYEALLIGEMSVTVTTADKWTRDPGVTSAKVDRALAGLEVDRSDIAARMAALIPSPDKGAEGKGAKGKGAEDKGAKGKGAKGKGAKDKGAKDKGAKDKGAEDKGASHSGTGDPMAVAYDALAALTAMVKRGETTARGRRAMMVSLRVSIDGLVNACKEADRADADRCVKA